MIQSFLVKYRLVLLGVLLGSVAGYAWYLQVGCPDGSCPITSHPLRSTAYGALVGALFAHSFMKKDPEPQTVLIDKESRSAQKEQE